MQFFKKLAVICLITSFAASSMVADHHERSEEARRDQRNSELMSGLLKGAGIAVIFGIASVASARLANAIASGNANQNGYGLIYSLLQGASSGFALGTIPCVLSGISGRENTQAWLGMAISSPIIGAVTGGMVSKPVTHNGKDLPVIGEVFKKLNDANIHPNSAATIGISATAVFTGIKPGVHRVQDTLLGRFYRERNQQRG